MTIKYKRDIFLYYIKILFSKIFLKSNNDKFLPGWKSVIANSTNTKLYSSLYRIVDSSNSELIPQIDVSEDKESEISEDIYPMR